MFHNAIKKILLLISILLISNPSFSQTKYSSDQEYILSKKENDKLLQTNFQSAYPDTSISDIHNYTSRNFSGNLGLPQPEYMLQLKNARLGFKLYDAPFKNDIITPQQIEYFQTKGPFASVSGFAGSKQEQTFRLLFSHTTKKKFNITVKFNRFGSLGYYSRQQTFVNNFYTSITYTNKKNRFGYYAYLLFNKVKCQENGGIKYDTLIRDEPTVGKDLLAVNLSNAKRENRNVDVAFNPWFKLNKKDSASFSHYIDYEFRYSGNYFWYLDNGVAYDGFYSTFYLDTVKTSDSTHLRQFNNTLHYTIKHSNSGIGLRIGYKHEYNQLNQHFDSILVNQSIIASLFWNKIILRQDSLPNKNKLFHTEFNYSRIFDGANVGDNQLVWNSELKLGVNKKGGITKTTSGIFLNVSTESRQPDFLYNHIYANSFRWNNQFKPVTLFQFQPGFIHYRSGLSLNVLWQDFGRYIYLDSSSAPKQTNIVISNWAYSINYRHVFLKHLGLCANICYQTTNKSSLMRIAPLQIKGALYYTGNLFKNNLQLQVGVQAEYYQAFKSLAYMPALNSYYLQNKQTVGEYPFVDIFLNARIKPVQFFLKIENVLQGVTGANYSFVPGYFQPDRCFRFGLTWLFFD